MAVPPPASVEAELIITVPELTRVSTKVTRKELLQEVVSRWGARIYAYGYLPCSGYVTMRFMGVR